MQVDPSEDTTDVFPAVESTEKRPDPEPSPPSKENPVPILDSSPPHPAPTLEPIPVVVVPASAPVFEDTPPPAAVVVAPSVDPPAETIVLERCAICLMVGSGRLCPKNCRCPERKCSVCIECILCKGDLREFALNHKSADTQLKASHAALTKAQADLGQMEEANRKLRDDLKTIRLAHIQLQQQHQQLVATTKQEAQPTPTSHDGGGGIVENMKLMMYGLRADSLFHFQIESLPLPDQQAFWQNQRKLKEAIYSVTPDDTMRISLHPSIQQQRHQQQQQQQHGYHHQMTRVYR